ncbi:MAG: Fe-S cluster assembly protein SufD [Flavobacteriaceae bacterium]|nr:Fe-S cluster assembly protein SufD [Flavobacteriaceae bacterium]
MALQEQLTAQFNEFQNTVLGKNLTTSRQKAWEEFQAEGFPTTKNEEWKYTSLRTLVNKEYELQPEVTNIELSEMESTFLQSGDACKIVFVNGVFDARFSTINNKDITVMPLSKAVENKETAELVKNYFDTTSDKKEVVNNLNTAFCTEGVFVKVNRNAVIEKPIQICYFYKTNSDTFLQPRNLIIAEENSQVSFIETHQNLGASKLVVNAVTEIFVAKNAILYFDKLQNNDNETTAILDHTFVEQKRDSVATVNTFTFGGKLIRNNLHFYQKEEHINSNLNGVVVASDSQLVDNHTLVHHTQPNCESHELYKGIYDDASTGVFNGKVLVNKEAQKLDAYQQNDNILIGDNASVNSKPQLEIFADDVRCSHGCTIGELDSDALFYMQQRGIAKKEAQALLLYAFASEAIEKIKNEELQQRVSMLLADKMNVLMEF